MNRNGTEPESNTGDAVSSGLDLFALGERMGHDALQRRLAIEARRTKRDLYVRSHPRGLSPHLWKNDVLDFGLHALRLYKRGYDNFRALETRHNVVSLPTAPPELDGYRILHLSDLHIDLEDSLTDVLIEGLQNIEYDLCVFTGDFRAHTAGSSDDAVRETARVIEQIDTPIYATLGNHDFIDTVPPLETAGIRFLLNEAIVLELGGEQLYLAGIDDANTFETHDLARASASKPEGCVAILLSHTPDVYASAAGYGYDLLLCGHTHAGQICLPGGHVIQRNVRSPSEMLQGAWTYRQMTGYTSAGAGATGLPIRFNCPPEITVHELRRHP